MPIVRGFFNLADEMDKIKSLLSIVLALCMFFSYGQNNPVSISYEVNISRDTILLFVNKPAEIKNGTLLFTATANNKKDKFFFPVIDSTNLFALAIPDSLAIETLQLQAFFYPKLFEIKGRIVKKIRREDIKTVLITNNKRVYSRILKPDATNEFAIPGLVFENDATLVFAYNNPEENGYPSVALNQTPIEEDFKEQVLNIIVQLNEPKEKKDSARLEEKKLITIVPIDSSISKITTMQTVTVETKVKSKAEKFFEENGSAMFSDINEKVIDCLSNDDILTFPDCLSFLQSKIGGLQVNVSSFGDNVLRWRGNTVNAFFIDEIPVDVEQLLSIPVTDIAVIKAFPPPFSGGGFGSGGGGAIALYTRTGEYTRPGREQGKWLFEINGYSPAIHILQFEQ